MRSNFSAALASNTVIPQSFARMAEDAGITNINVDQRNYPWIDPVVSYSEEPPFTKEDIFRSLGLLPLRTLDVQGKSIGFMTPADAKGRQYQKISKTHMQQVVDGVRMGQKYIIKDFFGYRPTGQLKDR